MPGCSFAYSEQRARRAAARLNSYPAYRGCRYANEQYER
jgi:hypothetical protein